MPKNKHLKAANQRTMSNLTVPQEHKGIYKHHPFSLRDTFPTEFYFFIVSNFLLEQAYLFLVCIDYNYIEVCTDYNGIKIILIIIILKAQNKFCF